MVRFILYSKGLKLASFHYFYFNTFLPWNGWCSIEYSILYTPSKPWCRIHTWQQKLLPFRGHQRCSQERGWIKIIEYLRIFSNPSIPFCNLYVCLICYSSKDGICYIILQMYGEGNLISDGYHLANIYWFRLLLDYKVYWEPWSQYVKLQLQQGRKWDLVDIILLSQQHVELK